MLASRGIARSSAVPSGAGLALGISHPVPQRHQIQPELSPHTPVHSRQSLSLCLGWALGANPAKRRWRQGGKQMGG